MPTILYSFKILKWIPILSPFQLYKQIWSQVPLFDVFLWRPIRSCIYLPYKVPADSLERHWSVFVTQQVDCQLQYVGSVMGSSLLAACGTPSSGLRTLLILSMTSQMPLPNRPFCSTQTSSDWSGSSWSVTLGYPSLSARNAMLSSTSATVSWLGFFRESTSHQLGKIT